MEHYRILLSKKSINSCRWKNLKQYVNETSYLPNIPFAEEMKDGIEAGKMNKMLMQQVEELTLYIHSAE
jgi:hypothetical protein